MDSITREAIKERKEENKREAAYILFEAQAWTVESIAEALSRPVIWVIQTLRGQGIDVKT